MLHYLFACPAEVDEISLPKNRHRNDRKEMSAELLPYSSHSRSCIEMDCNMFQKIPCKVKGGVHVLPDNEALSHRAASIFIELADSAIAAKNRFLVAVSGGSTPKRLFALLSTQYSDKVEWQYVDFFWVDERCVQKGDEESNFKTAYSLLLSKVPLPESNIHRIKGEDDPEQESQRYENDINNSFGRSGLPVFDLIILGMGEDGHTASLFPGSKSIEETERLAIPVYVEKLKSRRITLTLPVINNAKQILFLVSGHSKAEVLVDILEKNHRKKMYPAGLVSPVRGCVTWLVDKEAAVNLTFKKGDD